MIMSLKRLVPIGFLLLSFLAGYHYYQKIWGANVRIGQETAELYIPTGAHFAQVLDSLQKYEMLKDPSSFVWLAKQMKYGDGIAPKSGRYKIKNGWSNRELLINLRRGAQEEVNITILPVHHFEQIAGLVSRKLEADSLDILKSLKMKSTERVDSMMAYIIPNTYSFYWNTSAKAFVQRLKKEHKRFWNTANRLQKAKQLQWSPYQVYTLASIVEKETNHNGEKKRIAGVYLNRIRRGIPLQADPTVVYALRKKDIRRVLNKHLKVDSPYNTYKHKGLPPGPIGLASISSIDAVLDAEKHDYLFFCAKADYSGQHLFAETLKQHNRNAKIFREWLDKRGIK